MILDFQNLLSDTHALAATAYSTNTIDLGHATPKNDFGSGEPLEMLVSVDVTADTTSGNETYSFAFVQSVNADLSSEDILAQLTVPGSQLTTGSSWHVSIPKEAVTKRYVGAKYTLGGTTPSITVTTMILPLKAVTSGNLYAKGYVIS